MPSPEPNQEDSQRKRYHWHNHALVWAAVAAGVGAGLAAIANGYQAYLTRQNNIVSQRAFVYFDGIELRNSLDPASRAQQISFFMRLNNSGNTATKDLEFFVRCPPTLEHLSEPWGLFIRDPLPKQPQVIGPHQVVTAVCALSIAHLRQMSEGRAFAFMLGEITYRDRLDPSVLHKTQFSYEINNVNVIGPAADAAPGTFPAVLVGSQPIGQHNCADDDCPN